MKSPVDQTEMAFICTLIEKYISDLNDTIHSAPLGEDVSLERQNIFLFQNLLGRLRLPQPVLSIGEAKNMLLLTESFREEISEFLENPSAPTDLHNESVEYFKKSNHIIRKLKIFIRMLEQEKLSSSNQ